MLRHTVARFAAQTTVGLRTASIAAVRSKHTLPDLTYDYGALEPHISGEIMKIHHSKHHQVGSTLNIHHCCRKQIMTNLEMWLHTSCARVQGLYPTLIILYDLT